MIRRPHPLQVSVDLAVVLANVLRVPPVAPALAVGERRLGALERHVAAAHDGLAEVVEAVLDVPGVVGGWAAEGEASVGVYYCVLGGVSVYLRGLGGEWEGREGRGERRERRETYEAVELMCHGGGVDGPVGEVVEGRREAIVV